MTLGVRHDSADARIGSEFSPAAAAEFRAEPSPSPFARSGDGDAETETVAEEAAMDLNLSDSFEVPPGAEAAAPSVARRAHHALRPTDRDVGEELDGRLLRAGHGHAGRAGADEGGREGGREPERPRGDRGRGHARRAAVRGSIPALFTQTLTGSSSAFKRATRETTRARPRRHRGAAGLRRPLAVLQRRHGDPRTRRRRRTPGSDGDGFTPGQDTLLMMEKLKGRKHGDAVLDSVRRTRTLERRADPPAAWVAATPAPPSVPPWAPRSRPTARAPSPAASPASSAPRRNVQRAGASSAPPPRARPFGAFGEHTHTSGSPFAPGASQRLALRSAKKANDALALGLLGLPLEAALLTRRHRLRSAQFFHAREVSFMDAKNLRRKSLATTSWRRRRRRPS